MIILLLKVKLSNSLGTLPSHQLTMVAAIVYTVVVDSLFIRMVWISGTSLAELVMLRVVSRVSLVTEIPTTSVQLLILGFAADTFLEKLCAINDLLNFYTLAMSYPSPSTIMTQSI